MNYYVCVIFEEKDTGKLISCGSISKTPKKTINETTKFYHKRYKNKFRLYEIVIKPIREWSLKI